MGPKLVFFSTEYICDVFDTEDEVSPEFYLEAFQTLNEQSETKVSWTEFLNLMEL